MSPATARKSKENLKTHPDRARRAAEVLKALAHPIRLQIVALLCDGEAHVNGLAERLEQPQAIVSQQLRILRIHGLVSVSRSHGYAYYSLAVPKLRDFIRCVECGPFSER